MLAGQIKAVIFDMDGVLADSEPIINAAAIAMFQEKGLAVQPEDFIPFVGTGEDRYLGGVAEKHQFPLDLPAAKKRTYEIYLELVPARLRAFPGAVELVRACRAAGLKLAVASSADRIKIAANLNQIGLPPEQWDAVIGGEDCEKKKSAPDIFLAAAAKMSVVPNECCVVEDAVHGVEAAKAAGMRCVAVAQTFGAEQLRGADEVRVRIADLSVAELIGAALPPNPPSISPVPPIIAPAPPALPAADPSPWGFWQTIGIALIIAAVFVFAQIIATAGFVFAQAMAHGKRAFNPHELTSQLQSSGLFLTITVFVSSPVLIGLCVLFASLRRGLSVGTYLALRRVGWKTFVWSGLALMVLVMTIGVVSKLAARPEIPEFMLQAYRTANWLPPLWLAVIVMAPLSEELFFRGFVFEGLRQSAVGGAGAIFITSLFWASIHLQYELFEMGVIFAVGLLLGAVRLKTKSIYPCLFMHSLMNLLATIETAFAVASRAGG